MCRCAIAQRTNARARLRVVGPVASLVVKPSGEPFDVEVDGREQSVFDAELSEERDFRGLGVVRERRMLEGDDVVGEVPEQLGGVRVGGQPDALVQRAT
jgi:hypothetical protein